MNSKRLISLTACLILATIPGISSLILADVASETDKKAQQHCEKANELRKTADYDGAITEYKKVMSLSPKSKIAQDAQYWIGQSHFEAGQFDAALSAFQKLLDENPDSSIIPSTKQMMERVQQEKKEKTLVEAVKKGDVEQLKLLISKGADVNAKVKGWTLLSFAASHGHRDIAALLISKGADVNARNEHVLDKMPLHFAAYNGPVAVVELLIAKGADVNARVKYGYTSLWDAAKMGHLDIVELLISKGADIEAGTDWGTRPLNRAARAGHLDVVELLISKGANIDARGFRARTALHEAVRENHPDMVKLLLKRGAYVDARSDYGDSTPLHWAIRRGHQDVVELLLANGAAPWRRARGRDLVGLAMAAKQKEMMEFIIDKGFFEHSAVHVAAFLGDLDEVKSYLAAGGDINAQDSSRSRLLDCAILGGHTAEVEFLISKGADINLKDAEDFTPLRRAAYNGDTEIVRMLLDEGTDTTMALSSAVYQEHKDIVEMLLAKGADVNARGGVDFNVKEVRAKKFDEGLTPLHFACRSRDTALVEMLVANGADINAKTKNGETPILRAKRFGREQTVELLRKHGAKE